MQPGSSRDYSMAVSLSSCFQHIASVPQSEEVEDQKEKEAQQTSRHDDIPDDLAHQTFSPEELQVSGRCQIDIAEAARTGGYKRRNGIGHVAKPSGGWCLNLFVRSNKHMSPFRIGLFGSTGRLRGPDRVCFVSACFRQHNSRETQRATNTAIHTTEYNPVQLRNVDNPSRAGMFQHSYRIN